MSHLPKISIIIITYNRPNELAHTITALLENIRYDSAIEWIIADNGSPNPEYPVICKNLLPNARYIRQAFNVRWGQNVNDAMREASSDYLFCIEDDYVLTKTLDLSPYVALLEVNKGVGLVRLDGIGGHTGLVCHVIESDISAYCPNWRSGVGLPGKLSYFLLDRQSSHLNIYSSRPHLKHRRFHLSYGYYKENLQLGLTETEFAHRVKDMMRLDANSQAIAVPFDANSYFDHIGITWQMGETDLPVR